MPVPSVERLPDWLSGAAKLIAGRLRDAGYRGWIVGGAVRDLALGLVPVDADMASAATPEEVEALFPRTHAVGRAFGTVIVVVGRAEVELTTFRAERGYTDARRPDEVRYSSTPEEDAARRDFTCNALYLDPMADEVLDPTGGLGDLAARRLRCVGDPRERFREDGLRLLRLARFAAGYELEPEPAVLAAAAAEADALRGVSKERVLDELGKLCTRPRVFRAVALLDGLGLLDRAIPGAPPGWARRTSLLSLLSSPLPLALGLAALLDPACPSERGACESALLRLRPSRELSRAVLALWAGADRAGTLARAGRRADRVRLVRRSDWPEVAALAAARAGSVDAMDELRRFAAGLKAEDREPAPLIVPADLDAATIPRGPRFGELLRRAEDLQLEGELRSRDQALAWLRREVGS